MRMTEFSVGLLFENKEQFFRLRTERVCACAQSRAPWSRSDRTERVDLRWLAVCNLRKREFGAAKQ